MKKFTKSLLVLALLVLAVGGAKAVRTTIYTKDYSKAADSESAPFYCEVPDGVTVKIQDGVLVIVNPAVQESMFALQLHIGSGITTEENSNYKLRITYKTAGDSNNDNGGKVWVGLGGWSNRPTAYDQPLTASNNFQTLTCDFNKFYQAATDNFVMWQSGKFVGTINIKKVEIFKVTTDPTAAKAALADAIALGNAQNSFAKTTESWNALETAITNGETVYADGAATESSIDDATQAINDAIDALVLEEGYSDLTSDMFKLWNGGTADAIETGTAGCSYVMFNSVDMPYGDGSVSYNKYANLSSYERLVLVVNTGGTPRFLMNRDVDGGSWNATEANSHLIDNTQGGWSAKYFSSVTQDGVKIWTVDLAQLVTDKGFAHLHSIKSSGGNVTVSGMYLYKAPDPLAEFKEALSEKIDEANKKSSVGKTTESYTALTNAKNDAITALNDAEATDVSLTNAKNNLQDAIDGLKLAAGYANLTAEMFMEHNSVEDATVKAKAGCDYVINSATDQPYGDASVGEKKWADLTPYAELIINTVGTIKPRICMNRLEADGQQAETQVASKMIDINPNNNYTWSTTKYQTIEGNKYTINLESIVGDYGFARLHAIKKQGYGDGVYVTDMLVYAAKSKAVIGEAGYATFSSIMNVDMTGVNAYSAKYNGEEVELSSVTAVPANTGVIIQAAANTTYELTNIESADDIADNELKVSDGTVVGDGSTIYVLNKVADKVGFYLLKSGNKLAAGKAYLQIGGGSARAFIRISGMDVTGISTVKQAEGKKDDVIYNLNGQRVNNPTKGVFIKNGVKFLVD